MRIGSYRDQYKQPIQSCHTYGLRLINALIDAVGDSNRNVTKILESTYRSHRAKHLVLTDPATVRYKGTERTN